MRFKTNHLIRPLFAFVCLALFVCGTLHAYEVLGMGTSALLGFSGDAEGDLTDVDNDGVEGLYMPPDNLGGFDATFFSSDEPGFGGAEAAYNVFDNVLGPSNDKWCCGTVFPQIVGADFGERTFYLTHFTVSSANDTPNRDPRIWRIEGSMDNETWTTIFTQDDPIAPLWTARLQVILFTEDEDFPVQDQPFSKFRMVTEATGLTAGAFFQVGEIEFFGIEGDVLNLVGCFKASDGDDNLQTTFDAGCTRVVEGTSVVKYEWDFGDGGSGTGEIVDHTYAEAGDYTVTLTVEDSEGSVDDLTKNVTVSDDLIPVFTEQPQSVNTYPGADVVLSAVVFARPGDITYQWFKDGEEIAGETEATLLLESIDVEDDGEYDVTATANGFNIISDPAVVTVLVPDEVEGWYTMDIADTGLFDQTEAEISRSEELYEMSVTGSGHDIWGTADDFRFVWKTFPVDSDVIIQGLLEYFPRVTNDWAKAGFMFRKNLTQGSPYIIGSIRCGVIGDQNPGRCIQWRDVQDTAAAWDSVLTEQLLPYWIRLVYEEGFVSFYYATNFGETPAEEDWLLHGSHALDIEDVDIIYGGIAVSSHDDAAVVTAEFSEVELPLSEVEPTGVKVFMGDANGDGSLNIADAIFILSYLFSGGNDPGCMKAADVNDDSGLNIADAIGVLAYLFSGQVLIGPDGLEITADPIECTEYPEADVADLGCEIQCAK